jgi:outer membrane biogenesis lipoprotein LolB
MNARRALRLSRRALFLAAAAALAGCAVAPQAPPPAGTRPRLWSGRFSATYPDAQTQDGRGRASGRFRLERLPGDELMLELSSPLGQVIARARVGSDYAELQDARGEVHRAASDELLTERLFGWRIPVRALPAWLDPQDPPKARLGDNRSAAAGEPAAAGRNAWSVQYPPAQEGRPKVLELGFPAEERNAARQLRLRLAIDSAN